MIQAIEVLIQQHPAAKVAVAFSDIATDTECLILPHQHFHPASTIKIPIMLEVFHQADQDLLTLEDQIPITNTFVSIADGSPFSMYAADDSEPTLYQRLGQTATIGELVRLMIVASSNFATNLLIQHVSAQRVTAFMHALDVPDLLILRGPEDNRAYALGMNNVASTYSLMQLLRALAVGQIVSLAASQAMIDVLLGQLYTEGIPAGVPFGIPIAHKTGWNEQLYHDAAIVFPEKRKPYVLVVMTQGIAYEQDAHALVAAISRQCYEAVTR